MGDRALRVHMDTALATLFNAELEAAREADEIFECQRTSAASKTQLRFSDGSGHCLRREGNVAAYRPVLPCAVKAASLPEVSWGVAPLVNSQPLPSVGGVAPSPDISWTTSPPVACSGNAACSSEMSWTATPSVRPNASMLASASKRVWGLEDFLEELSLSEYFELAAA